MRYHLRCTLAVTALASTTPTHAQKTLRAVMNSDLKILDRIWTTAYVVRNHGYMIYDTRYSPPMPTARSSLR
jgi:peptide/nickel transport system substrate-binding protein